MTRATAAIAATAGLSLAICLTGATGSATAAPGAGTTPEKTCTSTDTFRMAGASGKKANISLCVYTNGTSMNVTASADCFSGGGLGKYDHCYANGVWQLKRDKESVAAGVVESAASGPPQSNAVYPGPGTYKLVANVTARASRQVSGGGFSVLEAGGEMERTITLTTPLPGPRLEGSATSSALTVTNEGDRTAKAVVVQLRPLAGGATQVTDDKRCRPTGSGAALECTLGDLASGASETVAVKKQNSRPCRGGGLRIPSLFWSYKAENVSEQQGPAVFTTLCARYRSGRP